MTGVLFRTCRLDWRGVRSARATEPSFSGRRLPAGVPMLYRSSVGVHFVDVDTGDPLILWIVVE